MAQQKSRYSRIRKNFLILFILSTLISLCGLGLSGSPMSGPNPGSEPSSNILTNSTLIATYGSCLTSIVTFIGFVSTTILAWRKEANERRDKDLERKLKEIELDKARLELEKMKTEQGKQSRKKTK